MQHDIDLISVGIPFFNAEQFLELAIKSVINQSYQNWELILIDDGSTDNSLTIAYKYANSDERIRVLHDGQNLGLSSRLNQLTKLSNGKYIARMDADDIMHPNRLEKQINILESYSGIDVIGTNAYTINEDNLVVGIRFAKCEKLQKVEHFIHPTIMASRDWFLSNPYDEKAIRIEDAELWQRTATKSKFFITLEPLLFYRELPYGWSKKYIKVIPSLYYLCQKYPYNHFWKRVILQSILNVLLYWFFEKLSRTEILLKRRNYINFNAHNSYKEFLGD